MNLDELKEKLKKFDLSEIKATRHAFNRVQDKRRKINYPQIIELLTTQKGLYKFEEQKAKNPDEIKVKLWFDLNYLLDMNVYVYFNREEKKKGLNILKIISAHKVRKNIQRKLGK